MFVNCPQCAARKTVFNEEKRKYEFCSRCSGNGFEWQEDEFHQHAPEDEHKHLHELEKKSEFKEYKVKKQARA